MLLLPPIISLEESVVRKGQLWVTQNDAYTSRKITPTANITVHAGYRDEDGVEERAETRTRRHADTKSFLLGLGWTPHRRARGEKNHMVHNLTAKGSPVSWGATFPRRIQSNTSTEII